MSCQSQSRTWGVSRRSSGNKLVSLLGCAPARFAVSQHDTQYKTVTHTRSIKVQRNVHIQKTWAHTGTETVCECKKKRHIHKTLKAHWEKRELMLLVTHIGMQLVRSVVTHRGITMLLS